MLQILTELLNYARKLLPLMEIYAARRPAAATRDPAMVEFQNYAAEALRGTRSELMEIRSALEALHQRLKVVDDQSASLQRELTNVTNQQRGLMIALIVSAVASIGAFITGIIVISRH